MAKTFASKKFHSLILANTLAMLAEFLMLFSDSVIAGNMMGEDALSAITLVTPFFSFLVFTGFLISTGTSIVISCEVGEGSRENANRYFGQGLLLSAGLSVVLTAGFFAARPWLPGFLGVSEGLGGYVADYYFYMCFLPFPVLLGLLFYNILLNEGGERYAIASTVVQFVVNIGLSILLCASMGIGGISLASVISACLGTAVLAAFFLSRRNPFRLRWFVSLAAMARVAQYSIIDASTYLYTFLMPLCLNVFLLDRFGAGGVVVFTVVLNTMLLMVTGFDGLGESIQPLISVYRGEGCQQGIRKTMESATRMALAEGIAMTALLLVFADYIPGLLGIATPELVAESAAAIRIFSLSACAVSLLMLYTSYFLYMDKIVFPASIVMLFYFGLPVTLGVGLGSFFGLRGVWIAFMVSGVLSLLVFHLGAKRLYGGGTRPPLLDPEKLAGELSYDVPKTPEGIDELVVRVERDLTERGVAREKILKIMMLIDSTEMYSMERGAEKGVVAECNLLPGDPITLILRDSGDRDDLMNEGAAAVSALDADDPSLNFVCRVVLGTHRNRQHILTTGKNRSIFYV